MVFKYITLLMVSYIFHLFDYLFAKGGIFFIRCKINILLGIELVPYRGGNSLLGNKRGNN